MNNIWFVSDTHFSHARVIEYSNRPFSSVQEMDEAMIANWNHLVKDGDLVYHLGDFSFHRDKETRKIIDRLNGNIHLILGNHDKEIFKNKNALLKDGYFATIQHYKELKVDGQLIVLLHYGMRVWRNSHHGSIQLFGHSHNSLPPHGKSVDVGVDARFIIPPTEIPPDCGDNSCRYAISKGGMRTNGGCRCYECPSCGKHLDSISKEHRDWCATPEWKGPELQTISKPIDYRPIHLDEILTYMKTREMAIVDHHGQKDVE